MNCPNCSSRSTGRVGSEQYYCWECCVEFRLGHGSVRVYQVDAEGELTAVAAVDHPDRVAGISPAAGRE